MSTTTFVNPEGLTPTASACKLHSFRVYYQMTIWMRSEEGIDPKNWDGAVMKKSLFQLCAIKSQFQKVS